jgi:hypothetical protein
MPKKKPDTEFDEFFKNKVPLPNKASLRGLHQYKKMTDEEFEDFYTQRYIIGMETDRVWEKKIQDVMNKYAEAYDLTDLKPNDISTLRSLIQNVLRLESLEITMNKMTSTSEEISANIIEIEKIGKLMESLRNDIAKAQDILNITRKARKGDQSVSVLDFITDLKKKGKEFYDKRSFKLYCPVCKTLLFQGWFLYPDSKENKIKLACHKMLDDGKCCLGQVELTSKTILERGGRNIDDIPDSLK